MSKMEQLLGRYHTDGYRLKLNILYISKNKLKTKIERNVVIICIALIPFDSQVSSFFKVPDTSMYLNISQINNMTENRYK